MQDSSQPNPGRGSEIPNLAVRNIKRALPVPDGGPSPPAYLCMRADLTWVPRMVGGTVPDEKSRGWKNTTPYAKGLGLAILSTVLYSRYANQLGFP